jgi:hypothetical protein
MSFGDGLGLFGGRRLPRTPLTADAITVDPHGTTSDHVEHEAIL